MGDQNDSQDFWKYSRKILNNRVLRSSEKQNLSDEEMLKAVKSIFNWAPPNSNPSEFVYFVE